MTPSQSILNSLRASILAPPPKQTCSEWAAASYRLSTGAKKGKFVPKAFQYEPLDCLSDPRVSELTIMSATQMLKTTIILVGIAYAIAKDPDPIMVVQPRDSDVQKFSKFRLAPMFRDIEDLKNKVSESRARDSRSTIDVKDFPGGPLIMTAAGSPGNLAAYAIRWLFCDEIDKFELSSGSEGDPISIAAQRQETFLSRAKRILCCSPTVKDRSRIAIAYENSDQRQFWVPCPRCKREQVLFWGKPEGIGGVKWDEELPPHERPKSAYYECVHCQAHWDDLQRRRAVDRGRWIARKPFVGKAGFHISSIYSEYTTLSKMVEKFLERKNKPLQLQTFINTVLAELWSDPTEAKAEASVLAARAEDYGPEIPKQVGILTAGVDVQGNRIELVLIGWGKGEEGWSLEHKVFLGDTSRTMSTDPDRPSPWQQLDSYLQSEWLSECNVPMRIAAVCVDAGYQTAEVAKWCGARFSRRVWATIGRPGSRPVWPKRPSRTKSNKQPIFVLGVDTAKESIYARLALQDPGPGYMHFPTTYPMSYYDQLTAEVRVPDYTNPITKLVWKKKNEGARNEVLDCHNNAYGALCGLISSGLSLDREVNALLRNADAEAIKREAIALGQQPTLATPQQPAPVPAPRHGQARRPLRFTMGF